MIRSKVALISSVVILGICMYLYFPFPNNVMLEARSYIHVVSNPQSRWIYFLGIIGSILFIIAMILLVIGMKKYHFRTIVIVVISICNFTKSSNYDVPRNVSKWHYSHFIRW